MISEALLIFLAVDATAFLVRATSSSARGGVQRLDELCALRPVIPRQTGMESEKWAVRAPNARLRGTMTWVSLTPLASAQIFRAIRSASRAVRHPVHEGLELIRRKRSVGLDWKPITSGKWTKNELATRQGR